MSSEIRTTYADPVASSELNPKTYHFTIFSNVFPSLSVTVDAEAIAILAQRRGVTTKLLRVEDYLDELRRFQPEFVFLATEKAGGHREVHINQNDVP